jgi:hypothetical protein
MEDEFEGIQKSFRERKEDSFGAQSSREKK